MSEFNTELAQAILKNQPIEEFFRQHLETAINKVLEIELTEHLGYEKNSTSGYNSGNSRNGFYTRGLDTSWGRLTINIPRDRNGSFNQQLIPDYARRTDDLETTIITLYKKGITTREIADLVEKLYGHHYSPTTVSNISSALGEQVNTFHERQLSKRYVVVYMDATYLSVRRDSVAKEPLHVLLGITPDGTKEIIDFALYPSESAANYEEMLASIKKRGVEDVLVFASDGLPGIRDAAARQFPRSQHQQCWVHLSRTVSRHIRKCARSEVLNDLKQVYNSDTEAQAKEQLEQFLEKHKKNYPRLKSVFEGKEESLFKFYKFPKQIRASLYTTNIIERSNKSLKRKTKQKEQFPNESALIRFVCAHYSEENRAYATRAHRGFMAVSAEILEMFEKLDETGKQTKPPDAPHQTLNSESSSEFETVKEVKLAG